MRLLSVKYACGHGEFNINGYGMSRRERAERVAWYEKHMVCSECYLKRKDEEESRVPKELIVGYRSPLVFYIKVRGDTVRNKDVLESIGFRWHRVLETWSKEYAFPFRTRKELLDGFKALLNAVEPLGYKPRSTNPLSELPADDLKRLKFDLGQYRAYKGVKYLIPPAPADTCYDFMRERHGGDFRLWNEKIYGARDNFFYYLKGTKYTMTNEQRRAIKVYIKERNAWKTGQRKNSKYRLATEFVCRLPLNFERWADAIHKKQ